ncbi:MAG: sugar phosphate isomerase/epimerase [Ktedonobacteraceae bacterium]
MTDIVALQLYTVRDETAQDFKQTVRRVAEIGYKGVEFAGYGGLPARDMTALLSETGLKAVGTHVGLAALDTDLEQQIDYSLEIGCPLLILPSIDKRLLLNEESLKQVAEKFNMFGQRCKERKLTFGYHNHDFEFEKVGHETLLERLMAATDPELVKMELDTYWVAYAGLDPIQLIQRYTGRIASLHLKDMTPGRTFTEVGAGTLDIAGYTEAGQAAGVTVYIVENDKPELPSLESARNSFDNMHRSLT